MALHPAIAWDFGSSVNFPEVVVQCVAEKIDNQSSLNHQKPHAFARLYGTDNARRKQIFGKVLSIGLFWESLANAVIKQTPTELVRKVCLSLTTISRKDLFGAVSCRKPHIHPHQSLQLDGTACSAIPTICLRYVCIRNVTFPNQGLFSILLALFSEFEDFFRGLYLHHWTFGLCPKVGRLTT